MPDHLRVFTKGGKRAHYQKKDSKGVVEVITYCGYLWVLMKYAGYDHDKLEEAPVCFRCSKAVNG